MISYLVAMSLIIPAQVELRGSTELLQASVIRVDRSGVHISSADGVQSTLGWHRIRAVHGELAQEAEQFASIAELAWRANSRLDRGDAIAAEPLFEELFVSYAFEDGPTGRMVAEGLLRCRLRRGAHTAAVLPWLALLETSQADGLWDLQSLDATTRLAQALPPIWLDWPAIRAFARTDLVLSEEIDRSTRDLAELYMHAARFEVGLTTSFPKVDRTDRGVALVAEIVLARSGDSDERRTSRKKLQDRLKAGAEPWAEAWCRMAIGRSLLRESAPEQKRRGIVELLHLPAAGDDSQGYLIGLALAQASVQLKELGDVAGSAILKEELERGYRGHPVLEWSGLAIRSDKSPTVVMADTGSEATNSKRASL